MLVNIYPGIRKGPCGDLDRLEAFAELLTDILSSTSCQPWHLLGHMVLRSPSKLTWHIPKHAAGANLIYIMLRHAS